MNPELFPDTLARLKIDPSIWLVVISSKSHLVAIHAQPGKLAHSQISDDIPTNGNSVGKQEPVANVEPALANEIALHVTNSWQKSQPRMQIEFWKPAGLSRSFLLYTVRLHEDHLITLTATSQTSIGLLRQAAKQLLRFLSTETSEVPIGRHESTVLINRLTRAAVDANNAFAIVWRPRKAVPEALYATLCDTVERIAGSHGCQIHYLSLRPEYIQLVVDSPSGQNSAWVAHTFKHGSEVEIQKQFNIPATLWGEGYLARASNEPLTTSELNIFLND